MTRPTARTTRKARRAFLEKLADQDEMEGGIHA